MNETPKGRQLPTLTDSKVVPILEGSMRPPNPLLEKLKSDSVVQMGMAIERDRQILAMKLRAMRKAAMLTQKEVARTLETTQKQISRMESCTNSRSVTLEMISRYAAACGAAITIGFEPVPSNVIDIEAEK